MDGETTYLLLSVSARTGLSLTEHGVAGAVGARPAWGSGRVPGGSGLVLRRVRSRRLFAAAAVGRILFATTVPSALTVCSFSMIVAVLAGGLRRRGLGATLRIGEDR